MECFNFIKEIHEGRVVVQGDNKKENNFLLPVGFNSCLLWPCFQHSVWRVMRTHKTARDIVYTYRDVHCLNCQMESPVPSTILFRSGFEECGDVYPTVWVRACSTTDRGTGENSLVRVTHVTKMHYSPAENTAPQIVLISLTVIWRCHNFCFPSCFDCHDLESSDEKEIPRNASIASHS